MFHVNTKKDENQYKLPQHVVKYIHKYMNNYIPEKELQEKILRATPVPKNIQATHHLDEFVRDIMKENKRSGELMVDSVLEKVECKTRDILTLV